MGLTLQAPQYKSIFERKKRTIIRTKNERRENMLRILCGLGGCVRSAVSALLSLLRDFLYTLLHTAFRLIPAACGAVKRAGQRRVRTASAAAKDWHRFRRSHGKDKALAFLRMTGILLLSEHGIGTTLFRFAVPALCIAFLWAVVAYGTKLDYCVTVRAGSETVGMIEDEKSFYHAADIVQQRLSYCDTPYEVPMNSYSLSLAVSDGSTPLLSTGDLANKMLRRAGAKLCEGSGVYLNDEFLGAVEDTHIIDAALSDALSEFSERLCGEEDELFYADEIHYEPGLYLAESLTDAEELANKLTSSEQSVTGYYVGANESVYTVAERFTTDPDTIRKLNPKLKDRDALTFGSEINVPVEKRFLPIVYRKTLKSIIAVPYETEKVKTAELLLGMEKLLQKGENGEREMTVQVTYTDGRESGRSIVRSKQLTKPVNAKLGIGIGQAQPYSEETVVEGSGHFLWPLNGGRITCRYGGERDHWGLDIGAAEDTEIYAADKGTVKVAQWNDSYGNYVVLSHPDGYETLYAHCNKLLVEVGDTVARGENIALVGTTGHSTGFHLHFETYKNGVRHDPEEFLNVNTEATSVQKNDSGI